jgi:hypothetical protein
VPREQEPAGILVVARTDVPVRIEDALAEQNLVGGDQLVD